MSIEHLFDHRAEVWYPSETRGPGGSVLQQRLPVEQVDESALNCALVPVRLDVENIGPGETTRRRVEFYFAVATDILERDVIRLVEGPQAPSDWFVLSVAKVRGHHLEIGAEPWVGEIPDDGYPVPGPRPSEVDPTPPVAGDALVFDGALWVPTQVVTPDELGALTFTDISGTLPWSRVSATPTTLAGYGITDAASDAALAAHLADLANPHQVTKAQVGLGSVENTALSTWPGSANITTVGTLVAGAVPASLVTAGTFGAGSYRITGAAGTDRLLGFQTAGVARWEIGIDDTAESGTDAGSRLVVRSYSDAGALLGTPLAFPRNPVGAGAIPFIEFNRAVRFGEFTPRLDVSNAVSSNGGVTTPGFQILGTGAVGSIMTMVRANASGLNNAPGVLLARVYNSDMTAVTAVASGAMLGAVAWAGSDGVDVGTIGGRIAVFTTALATANRMPSYMSFQVAAGASDNDITERMRLDSTGLVVSGALTIGNALNAVAPTAPNRTVTMVVGGTTVYLHAKTTND